MHPENLGSTTQDASYISSKESNFNAFICGGLGRNFKLFNLSKPNHWN